MPQAPPVPPVQAPQQVSMEVAKASLISLYNDPTVPGGGQVAYANAIRRAGLNGPMDLSDANAATVVAVVQAIRSGQ
jgi:hypothetical protein